MHVEQYASLAGQSLVASCVAAAVVVVVVVVGDGSATQRPDKCVYGKADRSVTRCTQGRSRAKVGIHTHDVHGRRPLPPSLPRLRLASPRFV